jgi:hypothetical protein
LLLTLSMVSEDSTSRVMVLPVTIDDVSKRSMMQVASCLRGTIR